MHCPKCHGKGVIPLYQLRYAHVEGSFAGRPTACDYVGCVNGIVHCCDGLTEENMEGDYGSDKILTSKTR